MDRSTLKMGGVVLVLLGVAGLVGAQTHGPQPATVQEFMTMGTIWKVSHIAIALAGALMVVSALLLLDGVSRPGGGIWAFGGSGLLLVGGVALFLIGALETTGFSTVAAQSDAAWAESAFMTITAAVIALSATGSILIGAAIAAYGIGMSGHEAWPGWLAWAGVAAGLFVVGLGAFGITLPDAFALGPFYLINAWFVLAGVHLLRMSSAGQAPVAAPVAPPEPGRVSYG